MTTDEWREHGALAAQRHTLEVRRVTLLTELPDLHACQDVARLADYPQRLTQYCDDMQAFERRLEAFTERRATSHCVTGASRHG